MNLLLVLKKEANTIFGEKFKFKAKMENIDFTYVTYLLMPKVMPLTLCSESEWISRGVLNNLRCHSLLGLSPHNSICFLVGASITAFKRGLIRNHVLVYSVLSIKRTRGNKRTGWGKNFQGQPHIWVNKLPILRRHLMDGP